MQKQMQHILTHRVITMLNRQEMEFLDKLGKDALFSTGHKLSYNEILKGLIEFAISIGLSGEKINSLTAFKERMIEKIKQRILKKEVENETQNT